MLRKSLQRSMGFAVSLVGVAFVFGVNISQAYTMMGDVSSYEEDGYNITFNCRNGEVRLSFLKEDLVRVHMVPVGNPRDASYRQEFPKDDLH